MSNRGHNARVSDGGDLGAFLRSRREHMKPEQVGFSPRGPRRTPGLRREELAALAGLSVEYLERLEQGRDTNPSIAVLAALAGALRLSDEEKQHLAMLAMKRNSAALLPVPRPVSDEPRSSVRALLDQLDPTPACLLGPIYNVAAWNNAWESVVEPLGVLDEDPPNLIRYHFLNPMAHRIFTDNYWALSADEVVGWLRSAQPDWGSDEEFCTLLQDVSQVHEFASRWAAHPVASRRPIAKSVRHPGAGILNIRLEVLLAGGADHWLQLWLPLDGQTASAIRALVADSSGRDNTADRRLTTRSVVT